MNRSWNQSRSEVIHQRLESNPEEWAQYHTLYREARKDWGVIPYEEIIRWCEQRSGYTIGDFGCGEAKLAEAVSDQHYVHSFDHVAANDGFVNGLKQLGFDNVRVEDQWKFTHIHAIKVRRQPQVDAQISF